MLVSLLAATLVFRDAAPEPLLSETATPTRSLPATDALSLADKFELLLAANEFVSLPETATESLALAAKEDEEEEEAERRERHDDRAAEDVAELTRDGPARPRLVEALEDRKSVV